MLMSLSLNLVQLDELQVLTSDLDEVAVELHAVVPLVTAWTAFATP